ncbi:MAG: FAD:protein FMN transferase [Acidobacteria bacterium]|nr:MAG: FAD:protein FMN transferase [Acidobacteriota bacterium]
MAVTARSVELAAEDGVWAGRFRAMGGPCEVLVETGDPGEARAVAERVADCAWRIEDKYSRYRRGNVVDEINTAGGRPVTVDEETAKLLDFAATLYDLSDGLFDITSGVLRRAWTFDGGTRVPTQAEIDALLPLVGWDKVQWNRPKLRLPPGMQLDFGGIGKEYAVDQAVQIARNICSRGSLVNFGGDLAVSRPRAEGRPWRVGIANPALRARAASRVLDLRQGALATSGDTHRFVLADGTRYSHILNPRSGWPVRDAPRSVTVAAGTCTQAGMLTTLAVLAGKDAERFLDAELVPHWVIRH